MPTTDQLQFEMQRRVILFNSGTTMPDNTVLGYEGNPNYAATADTPGQTLLYNSPRGTSYIELVNGNLWYKQRMPNTWINLTSGTQSGTAGTSSQNNVVFTTGNQDIAGVKNFYSRPTVNGSGVLLIGETGSVDLPNTIVYTVGNQTIGGIKTFDVAPIVSGNRLITGLDLSSYATSTNLYATGSSLDNKINSLSGYVNAQSTSGQIFNTGSNLDNKINSLSGYVNSQDVIFSGQIFNTGNRLDSKINTLSGYIDSKSIVLPTTIVYTTGEQNIGGTKTFASRPTVNGTGFLLSGDISATILPNTIVYTTGDQIIYGNKTFFNNLQVSGTGIFQDINIINLNELLISGAKITIGGDSGVYSYTNIYVSGNAVLTGINLNPYATTVNLAITGSILDNKINSLSGYVTGITGTFGILPISLASTGSILDNKINSLSGYVNSQTASGQIFNTGSILDNKINSLSGYLNSQDVIFSGQTASTGSNLNNKINSLSGYVNTQDALFSGQTSNTGSRLDNKINSLSGYVDSRSITLPTTIVYTTGNQNISGIKNFPNGITSILEDQNPASTTLSCFGINIFDGDQNTVTLDYNGLRSYTEAITIKTEDSERIYLATNNQNRLTITPDGNIGIGTEFPSEALEVVGNIKSSSEIYANNLVYNVNNQIISGVKTFASRPNVNGTGFLLSGEAANITLPNTIVYTTGDQTISGVKTFDNYINLNGDLYSNADIFTDTIQLNTITDQFDASTFISLNSKITLLPNSGYVGITGNLEVSNNVYAKNLVYNIENQTISGIKTFTSGIIAPNLVYITGNQTISGVKTFVSRPTVNGTGFLLSGEAANITLPSTIVYTTGNQTISGIKTFANNLEVQGTGIFNALDLSNISEFNFSGTNINLINGNVNISGGTLYISGNAVLTGVNLNAYATTANLFATGSTLDSKINSLSGYVNAQSTSGQVFNTGSILDNKINSLSGYVNSQDILFSGQTFNTGSILDNKINTLSGVSVLTFGNQNVNGVKTFNNGLATTYISGVSGISLNILGYSDSISAQTLRNINITAGLGTSTINAGDIILIGGNLSGIAPNILKTGASITIGGARTSASTSDITIKPSIDQNGTAGNIVLGAGVSTSYNGKINMFGDININGTSDGGTALSSKNINIYRSGSFFGSPSQRLAISIDNNNINFQNGMGLQVSGVQVTPALYATSANLASTGSRLDNKINSLSGYVDSKSITLPSTIVYTTGNQNISGTKTFFEGGDYETRIAGGNISFHASDNGDAGVSIGYGGIDANETLDLFADDAITLKNRNPSPIIFGTNDIYRAAITSDGDFGIGTIYPSEKLEVVGNIKASGASFNYRPTVNGTGVLLSGEAINFTLPNNIVYTTGNQIISGNKTFLNNVAISGTGIFNALDLNNIDTLSLSGVDISLTNGNVTLTNRPTVNGTGVVLSGELNSIIVNTGSLLNNKINSLSGYVDNKNIILSGQIASTGSILDSKINALSGYINSTGSNILFTTGNQTINGNKSFTSSSVLTVRTISGFQTSTSDSLNLIATNDNGSAPLLFGGDINLTAGTGSVFSYSNYGAINLKGNININNNSSMIPRTINIYKTGTAIGFPAPVNALTIDENNISLNTISAPNKGFGLYISGVGVTPALYATITNLASTGSILDNKINSLSGYVNSRDSLFSGQTASTGSILDNKVNSLSGYVDSKSIVLPTTIVYTTGNQTISGSKTFASPIVFSSGIVIDGTPGAGGSIDLRGGDGDVDGGDAGSINLRGGSGGGIGGNGGNISLAGGGDFCTAGSLISNAGGGTSANGGTLDMSGGIDSNGGSINTKGGQIADHDGGSIDTSGGELGAGGSINTSNAGGSINTSGLDGGGGGSIDTSGTSEGPGGSINTSNSGGSINTMGGDAGSGGSINTSAGDSDGGGSINTSGGDLVGGAINTSDGGGSIDTRGDGSGAGLGGSINTSLGGGSINTSNGGGSINTREKGFIEFGSALTRTILSGNYQGDGDPIKVILPNANGTLALDSNVAITGSILDNKINTLSGYVNTISAGSSTTSISGANFVYTTGNQIISGAKTFVNNIIVSGTGLFNSFKASNIDKLILSGVDVSASNIDKLFLSGISITTTNIDKLFLSGVDILVTGNSSINVYNNIYISGNPVLTGAIPTNQNITNVVHTTGNQTISGNKNFVENVIFGDQAQDDILVISGETISFGVYPTVNGTGIVYTRGNQIISGIKTFASRPTVNGTGVLLIGEASSSSSTLPNTIVYTTGNQLISGNKTFSSPVYFSSGQNDGIYLGGSGGYIDLRGGNAIDAQAGAGGIINLAGSANGKGGSIDGKNNGGSIKFFGTSKFATGGLIDISAGPSSSTIGAMSNLGVGGNGGSLRLIGGQGGEESNAANGGKAGSIIGNGGEYRFIGGTPGDWIIGQGYDGGIINFSAGLLGSGGSIDISNGGGSINFSQNSGAGLSIQTGNLPIQNNGSIYNKINDALYIRKNTVWEKVITNADNPVYTTGNQTISGVKTFANTGSFDTLQITNKKLSSYNYISSNFTFGDAHINIVNSSNNVIGTLPSSVTSGINYYVKNLNTGVLLITGSNQRTIDGFSNINLYKNESLQLLGVNNIGYTGWISLSVSAGVS